MYNVGNVNRYVIKELRLQNPENVSILLTG